MEIGDTDVFGVKIRAAMRRVNRGRRCWHGERPAQGFRILALQRGFNVSVDMGGERGPVAPAVFKTVVSSNGGVWVRLPFTSAISWNWS